MRVIAGKAKRLKLRTVDGLETRPTTDRIKETLFNILNPRLADCDFLDLFSGSGAIGIEALSRGAGSAVFVENGKGAVDCIKYNLHNTGLDIGASILAMDVLSAIRALEVQGKVFDIIFMDPPYNKRLEKQVLEALMNSNIIYYNTLIIVEASIETGFEYLENSRFQIYKEKEYKTNKHVFIELK
ncbi:16S rRNA (guanine(966)-N(2))-methyltransferase RsmD [Anaerocolumna sedimenticola]|uniref:16S rRNA (Guanine(966)-N(2))-methyltransferase RsmD n=1 Tax=Anaerocolumna sedimenticola TaxID=2696063 RepID=A0A6P1TND5_9FIRM|nr:16S rRNA (guanine(966)-N(2))-methyltransferase RsmD [Anaerocolumna sedimenticola]QHQ62504.1 16S rRNA (guanine(966)-N(2))-methyltransferase RsmD [Anaerocolumna sedimenticola]